MKIDRGVSVMRTFCKRNRGLCFGLELALALLLFALVGVVSEVEL